MLTPDIFWITGGEDPQPTGTSEFVGLVNNSLVVEDGPELPLDVLGHCMISLTGPEIPIQFQIKIKKHKQTKIPIELDISNSKLKSSLRVPSLNV